MTTLHKFRWTAIAEGISYIFLLFIAMPIKYFGNNPVFVKYGGWVHGLLFVAYFLFLINASIEYKWNFKKVMKGIIASLLPFGPFIFDKELKVDERNLSK